jgi:Holliday junction resolvasome RuvABC ATP-dependent DNA helicase subunit
MLPLLDFFKRKRLDEGAKPRPTVPKIEVRYTGENFKMIEGLDDVKVVLERSLKLQSETRLTGQDYRVHVLLAGPPGIAKTMLLMSAEKEIPHERRIFLLGSQVSKAGLRNKILERRGEIDFIFIDELDKMGKSDYDVLLSLMQTGRISVLKAGLEAETVCMATVLATANYLEKIPVEVLDRFMILYLPQYSVEDFEKLALNIFTQFGFEEEQARNLAKTMWSMNFRHARDLQRVARYARGNIDKAMEVLSIMAMRAPPEVRRK